MLNAEAVIEDDGGEGEASEVGDGVFVVAVGDAAPLLETPEAAFDGAVFFVRVGVEVSCGFPPSEPLVWGG